MGDVESRYKSWVRSGLWTRLCRDELGVQGGCAGSWNCFFGNGPGAVKLLVNRPASRSSVADEARVGHRMTAGLAPRQNS